MADPSRTASVGDGLDGLKRVGLPASAHQRLAEGPNAADRLLALSRDAPDEQGDVRTLPSTVGVKLIKNEVPEMLENGISNGPLLHPSEQELKHHVVGEDNVRRVFAHGLPPVFLFLAGVLAEENGKRAPGVPLVVVLVGVEFGALRVDQRVHRIDDDGGHPRSVRIGEQVIEDCADVGQ